MQLFESCSCTQAFLFSAEVVFPHEGRPTKKAFSEEGLQRTQRWRSVADTLWRMPLALHFSELLGNIRLLSHAALQKMQHVYSKTIHTLTHNHSHLLEWSLLGSLVQPLLLAKFLHCVHTAHTEAGILTQEYPSPV